MSRRLEDIRRTLIIKRGEYDKAKARLEELEENNKAHLERLKTVDASVAVVQSVAAELQNSVMTKVSSIVQKALDATFPEYMFSMEFVSRRDKTEVDMCVTDLKGNRQSILDGCGGGLKDIISFALRVAVWSLDRDVASVLVLDEPFKFLSRGMRDSGAKLLGVLSHDLGIQFLVVSHVDEIVDNSDTVYVLRKGADGVTRGGD